jgi:hypothetical protein
MLIKVCPCGQADIKSVEPRSFVLQSMSRDDDLHSTKKG